MLIFLHKTTDTFALYKCDCGKEIICSINRVNKGWQKGCGCKRKRYGLSGHALYSVWINMKDRCYNIRNEKYHRYGGRGVTVCDLWVNDFKPFYDWCMANGWREGLDVDKDIKAKELDKEGMIYSPEWCSIVTGEENINNRSTCVFITRNGVTKNTMQWCEEYGLKQSTFYSRISKGWTEDEAFTTPARKVDRNKTPPRAKITHKIADDIREIKKKGYSNAVIGKMFSVDASTISTIVNNKSWIK